MKKQVELSITHNGEDVVTYPYTKKEHVQFENGMNIDEFVGQDIATPTITHDTTAIKVGVGDSDVSSSVVDTTVNMTIKGQTYQNILPDPTLRNEMQGKSMQRLNEGYDSIETVDGVSKSAILKGQTLVNLFEHFKFGCNHDANTGIYTSTQDEWVEPVKTTQNVKTNVTYTLFAKVNTTSDQLYIRLDYNSGNVAKDRVVFGEVTPNNDINIKTTVQFGVEDKIRFVLRNAHGGIVKMSEIMLVEGDYTNQDIPYFTGMTSCKMPVLQTVGKNLFDKVSLGLGGNAYTNTVEYLPQLNNNTRATLSKGKLITVEPNSTVTLSCDNRFKCVIQEYDENENRTKSGDKGWQNGGSHTLTVGEKTNKINIYFAKQDPHSSEGIMDEELSLLKNSIQMETSSSKTTYEPYKTNILTTPEEVVLKGLGDVKDTLNINTGEYVQRIGEVVFDEKYQDKNISIEEFENVYRFQMYVGDVLFDNDYSHQAKFDKFITNMDYNGDFEHAYYWNDTFYFFIEKSKIDGTDSAFKEYIKNNPITFQSVLKAGSIKTVDLSILDQNGGTQENLHSFANGHLQVSSEVENSLLPSVQYEIPTKNSYHMDLMKTNTLYTMKAKTVSGTFTIDGTSYNVNANGTFTSPSSMTDKLLVMSNKTNEEVMLLEGNVIDKTIPYFKGIKSAFEGEDKIEVLSTGKNLFDIDKYALDNNLTRVGEDGLYINRVSANLGTVDIQYKKKTQYVVGYQSYELLTTNDNWTPTIQFKYSDGTQEQLYLHTDNRKVSNVNKDVVEINIQNPWANVTANVYGIYVEEFPSDTTYEPHKSNTTKIPLLHPLRSLPNGVCDELIIDRLNHKAKLIQRVGCSQLKGNAWTHRHAYSDRSKDFSFFEARNVNHFKKPNFGMISPQFPTYQLSAEHLYNETRSYIWCGNTAGEYPYAWIETSKLATDDVAGVKRYFDSHPLDLHHELATPIITEIDLEGYPYAYKDGHIFLNSDIAPTTEITYSINQAQQIESANENLQRHEKEISHLQKLIAQYIQVEYESTLLSLKI